MPEKDIKKLKEKIKNLEEKYKNAEKDKLILNSLLEKTSKDLQKALQAQRNFIAMISHEIRTPLNSIIGFLEILQNSNLSPHQKHLLSNAHKSSLHLLSLINKVLDISKIEAGELEVMEEEFDLEEVMMDCAIIISSRVEEGVELITDIQDLPFTLKGDPVRIKQIFLNILGNAAKFTKKGYIKFSIESYKKEKGGKIVLNLLIEDTGPGIAQEKLSALFQPFQQLETSESTGTGLGLYFAKSLALLMEGDITVESIPGKGSKFYITLSLKKAKGKNPQKILLDRNIGAILEEGTLKGALLHKLKSYGIKVTDLCSKVPFKEKNYNKCFQQIISELLKERWDLLILDEKKIKKGGIYLAGILKTYDPSVKIIYLTDSPYLFIEQKEFDEVLHRNESFYKIFCFIKNTLSQKDTLSEKKENYKEVRVLVAEDETLNQELFKELFSTYFGIKVDIAKNGLEAVKKVSAYKYDIIFMDIKMPKLDGLKATEEIRKFNKETPIIAISANTFSEDIEKTKKVGMNGYISKPIEVEKLKDIIISTLKLQSTETTTTYENKKCTKYENKECRKEFIDSEDLKDRIYSHFKKLFGESGAKRLTQKSIKNINEILKRIEKYIESEDRKGLIKGFHSLKGVLLNSGLSRLSQEAESIEKALREEMDNSYISNKIEEFLHNNLHFSE